MSAFDVLKERGFLKQFSHEQEIEELLKNEKITFYIGFDPTADSLHIGHFIALMAMSHMQRDGHRPICLIGGGTTLVGDPSGKDSMRRIMTKEEINDNANKFKKQMSKFIDFEDGKALIVNNADWLLDLNYIDLLREVGIHFSVNRMLSAECFKQRMERGLSFFEFNYMIMQSYDFWKLFNDHNCVLQMGGDDQWSNILAGAELIRKKERKPAFCMTCKLLTTSDGVKMGKTVKGALWLDPEKTSPYEFYQYWININDADVENCLCLLTYMPMDEVKKLASLEGQEINKAKQVLAFEVTKLIHGEKEAIKARETTAALFAGGGDSDDIPTIMISETQSEGKVVDVLTEIKITASKGECRRLINGGGLYINDEKVKDVEMSFTKNLFDENNSLLIRKGKKIYHKLVIES